MEITLIACGHPTNVIAKPSTAKKLIGRIKDAVMSLAELPNRHSLIADETLAVQGIRKLFVDNYIVFCVINEENKMVIIVRILYNKRDWVNLL